MYRISGHSAGQVTVGANVSGILTATSCCQDLLDLHLGFRNLGVPSTGRSAQQHGFVLLACIVGSICESKATHLAQAKFQVSVLLAEVVEGQQYVSRMVHGCWNFRMQSRMQDAVCAVVMRACQQLV